MARATLSACQRSLFDRDEAASGGQDTPDLA